jgi:hypothetical protein
MLHVANIVPQIEKARSKSGVDAVSYQTTRRIPAPNWEGLPWQSEPGTGRAL